MASDDDGCGGLVGLGIIGLIIWGAVGLYNYISPFDSETWQSDAITEIERIEIDINKTDYKDEVEYNFSPSIITVVNGEIAYFKKDMTRVTGGVRQAGGDKSDNRFGTFYINGIKHGPCIEEDRHDNNEITKRCYYKKGKLEGKYWSGDKYNFVSAFYKNGELDGIFEETVYKQLRERIEYKNGKKHGLEQIWSSSGQLLSKTEYKDGNKHGFEQTWNESGQLLSETEYLKDNKHGSEKKWKDEILIEVREYSKGEKNGREREFYETKNATTGKKTLKFNKEYKNGEIVYQDCYTKDGHAACCEHFRVYRKQEDCSYGSCRNLY